MLVDRVMNDGARTGRTLLPLIAGERFHDSENRLIVIHQVFVDDDGVLSTHFRDNLLDRSLIGPCLYALGQQSQSNIFRSGKGYEIHLRMGRQGMPELTSARQNLQDISWNTGFVEKFDKQMTQNRRTFGRFKEDDVARHQRG